MSIYDVNYNNKAIELLPPDKRTSKHVAWVQALLSQVQVAHDKMLGVYRSGITCPQWWPGVYSLNALVKNKGIVYQSVVNAHNFPAYDSSGATIYQPGQFVNYNNATWVCLTANNGLTADLWMSNFPYNLGQQIVLGGTVYQCTHPGSFFSFNINYWEPVAPQYSFIPSDWVPDAPPSQNWQQYLPSFLGTDERVQFNGTKLVLEYALNQYYSTNFRQPGLLGYWYPFGTPGQPGSWSSTISYVPGNLVLYLGHIYKCLNPVLSSFNPDGDPTNWAPLGLNTNYFTHSDIFILNNKTELVGFNIGTCDFLPANWTSSGAYTAYLSKVLYTNGHIYLCKQTSPGSSSPDTNPTGWIDEGVPPAGAILTAGVIIEDIGYPEYEAWTSQNYTTTDPPVIFDNYVYVCIKNTVHYEEPGNETYWFQIPGIGFSKPFLLGDNFTIYFPQGTYNQTNDSEMNNFVKKLAYAGTVWSVATY